MDTVGGVDYREQGFGDIRGFFPVHLTTETTTVKLLTTHLHRTAALVGAAALAAAGLLGVGAPSQADEAKSVWDRVAACESSGDWSINTGNGYYGGLQFSLRTWKAFGGEGMPHEASREEQIRIAQKTLAVQGPGAWPTCGKKAGLTKENGAADDGRADESKKDEPKKDEPKDEPKAEEPTEEPKNDEPTEEPKADEPKSDEDSTNGEPKQDEPKAEEPKSDEPADDSKPEDPKDDDSTTEDESLTETPGSEGAGTDDGADENSSNANDTGLTGHVIDLNK